MMKPEDQRIAIALALGLHAEYNGVHGWVDQIGCSIPDYLNDLNAMRQVEMWMFKSYNTLEGAERLALYTRHLTKLKHPLFATASQRAEAFLRTLDLWTPSP